MRQEEGRECSGQGLIPCLLPQLVTNCFGYRAWMRKRQPPVVPAAPTLAPGARFERVDALRGVAMWWMAAFHGTFDLNHFGFIAPQDFYRDPLWTRQRIAIVSLFLFTSGIGQALAVARGQTARRFWRRWGQIAGCALLVSVGSWFMFPESWISFGVLHGIAVMLLLLRLLAPLPPIGLLVAALAALALPWAWQHSVFDTRWTNWVGLVTHKPRTEDYVPVLPWLGVMVLGFAAGRWLLARQPAWWAAALPNKLRPLARLGQWPLSFYMLHQPVLIGLMTAWQAVKA
jgi:uncharacterized membrane protein